MPPTMRDVAARAGVSVKTVSRLVNRERYVRDDVARKVLVAIDELGWVASGTAPDADTASARTLLVYVPTFLAPGVGVLVESLVQEVERRGLRATVERTSAGGPMAGRRIGWQAGGAAGLLLVGGERPHAGEGTPIVVDAGPVDGPWDRVAEDAEAAAALVVRHLTVMGRRRPALLEAAPEGASGGSSEAFSPVAAALVGAGMRTTRRLAVSTAAGHRSAGARGAAAALRRHPDLDAIVCSDDEIALGAMSTVLASGRRVPDDVAVIGHGALEDGEFATPSLTTIDPDYPGIARTAVDLLTERLAGSSSEPRVRTTQVSLLRRESTMGRR